MGSFSEKDHVRFPLGLPAFESEHEFRLITQREWHPFLVMESLREGGPRFICVEIAAVEPGYAMELGQEDAEAIGATAGRHIAGEGGPGLLGIVATADDGSLTANLAAPLVVSPAAGLGVQSIQPGSDYSPFTVILPAKERESC